MVRLILDLKVLRSHAPSVLATALGIAAALLWGCQSESAQSAHDPKVSTSMGVGSAGASAEESSAPTTLDASDPALRAAYIRTRQLDADEAFSVRRTERGAAAVNMPTTLELRYEAERVSMKRMITTESTDTGDALESEIRFTAIGRDGVWAPAPEVEGIETDRNLVVYQRAGIMEQYLNGPLGLEQFFTIAEAPSGTGRVELVVDVAGDLSPALEEQAQYVELRDAEGRPVMEISELFVSDATGSTLTSQFHVRDGRVILAFDDSGATYPVEVDPLVTTLRRERTPSDATSGAQFGYSVAIHENVSGAPTALIGAPYAGNGGAAYVFKYDFFTRDWTQTAKLVPGTAAANNGSGFGVSVAIGGQGMLFVGAPYYAGNEGRVFIFDKDTAGDWVQRFKIALFLPAVNDRFGASLGAGLFDLIVGVPGREIGAVQNAGEVALFTAAYTANGTPAVSVPTEVHAPTPATDENFGSSVAMRGTLSFVGAPGATVSGTRNAGRVYAYKKSDSSIARVQTLNPPAPTSSGRFGSSVALTSGPCVTGTCTEWIGLVSEPGADPLGTDSGSAHVYVNTSSSSPTYTRQTTLNPPYTGTAFANYFRVAVGTYPNPDFKFTRAVIGASSAGSAPIVIFQRVNGMWNTTPTTIAVPSTSPSSRFGSAVALNSYDLMQLIAGAPLSDRAATDAGRVFFYDLGWSNGMACVTGAMCTSGFCFDGVCCNADCGGPTADCQACSTAAGATANGTCSTLASNTVCRNAAGTCDVAESCNGTSTSCPVDGFKPYDPFTACRGSINIFCDPAELCSGTGPQCPADVNMCQ